MAEQESEKSAMIEDEDLEDGEIEDDDEPEPAPPVVMKPPEPQKSVDKEKSTHKKKSSQDSHQHNKKSPGSSSRKDKSNQDEDDFMSNIENAIAENLKKSGIEPPMPSVKKPSEPEPENDRRRQSRNSQKRRNRKRDRKDQKREGSARKRPKVSDNEGLYMVGGSPNQSGSESEDDDASNSSYDSEEYQRTTYEERRNKRRDRYGSNRERERDRDRDRKDNKKNRDRQEEKEVCLRFSEYGHCPDDDCQRSHDVRQPKKMELCKFWLMECCAKKDKCSYMHGDFPCKYYYLGLKCVTKDCKFSHGRPLSDNLKQILLKHLDTAPKEILGDFPRIGRDNASKMIAQTHINLCKEFNVPLPEAEKEKNVNKIPSLLEMNIKPPHSELKNEKRSNKNSSRWLENNSPARDSPSRSTAVKEELTGPGAVVLADLRGILSEKQVESMAAIGVITVNHINNLTVAQLNDLGLSLATIGEIQATAMNMDLRMANIKIEKVERGDPPPPQQAAEDIDYREPPPSHQHCDVDMRVVPVAELLESAKSPDTIMSPNQSDVDECYKKPEPPAQRPSSSNMMMSPPSGLDYSQYLKDSNLNNDDEVEDEPGLRIDETYCTSDYEQEDKKDSQSEDDQQSQDDVQPNFQLELLPPSFDTSNFLKSTVVTKIDVSSSVSQLMEKETPKPSEAPSPSRDPRARRDPRMAQKSSPAEQESSKIPEISSPTYRDPRQKVETPRASIYEIESPSEDEDLVKIDRDKDMRLPPFLRDSDNGDVDLRFPFTPMANYVPATEIEASYGTFVFEKYEVKIVDVPKPDYSEIRRNFRQNENTQDPRLKKLCGLLEETATTTTAAANKTGLSNILPIDPRKRKNQDLKDEATPKKLQISTILQNSKHYNELSSSQKMIVNEVLAELSKQLKLFHADSSLNKIFDAGFITQRPKLQQILIGLGVFVNADGDFEEIKEMPMVTMPNIHQLPPMIPTLPPPSLMTLNQPPPNFIAGGLRPGLLGIAPNLPFGGNFDGQDSHMNFPPMNQGMPFGDQFSNRDFGSNQNNRRDQRQQNSSFRNNNNNRNNNYSRHRRN